LFVTRLARPWSVANAIAYRSYGSLLLVWQLMRVVLSCGSRSARNENPNYWLQFFAERNCQITTTITNATKQKTMRKTVLVQRLVLAESSVGNEACLPFTKSKNMSLPLPILVSPLDFEPFAGLSLIVLSFITQRLQESTLWR
jgi:hypothetical protein